MQVIDRGIADIDGFSGNRGAQCSGNIFCNPSGIAGVCAKKNANFSHKNSLAYR